MGSTRSAVSAVVEAFEAGQRRRGPRGDAQILARNPVMAELVAWVAAFEAGEVPVPEEVAGVLEPGERLAVVIGPVTYAAMAMAPTPTVREAGATGTLVATDRRLVLATDGAVVQQWVWGRDVGDGVTALLDGLGVCWVPSDERHAAGVQHMEGLVVPELAAGQPPVPDMERTWEFDKVQAAWRASLPGGADLWLSEQRWRYRA